MLDLEEVFGALRRGGMHLKAKKCLIAAAEVRYLGHVVGVDGVRPDPLKTKVIDEFTPESRADLSSFNGMCSFYRKYIKNYAHKARPLTVYINSRKPFEGMTKEVLDAVSLLKKELTSAPIMAHPNFDLPFEIHCDASPHALGATLVQQVAGEEKVIMYISRTLKKHELSYHQYEREMLAVVWSIAVFKAYTIGARFKVVTDNAAVATLKESSHTNPRLMRWVLALNAHRIDFQHRPGSKHCVPDSLSRGFHVPADFVYEKDDVVEALCSMEEIEQLQETLAKRWGGNSGGETEDLSVLKIKRSDERESYMLPGREDLVAAQEKDVALKELKDSFEGLPDADRDRLLESGEGFFIRDNILFRRVETQPKYISGRQIYKRFHVQICVPKELRRPFLYSLHGMPISGHDGVERTRARLEAMYWWKGYKRDVKAWVGSCFYCQKRKPNKPARNGLTGNLNTTRPFQVVGFDIVKLTKSESGNQYLLTMIDHFSRYPLAVPIPNRKMETVVQALHSHLICVFGMPSALLSDQERAFTSEVTKGLLRKLGIAKLDTSGYMPTGNSRCERFHRYLNASLTMFVDERKADWEKYIDSILFAYRTSMCTSTGFTPFELVFGRKASLPPDILYTVDGKQMQEEYRRGIATSDSVREAYSMARERQVEVSLRNKDRRDKDRKKVNFKEGSAVFIFDQVYDKEGARKLRYRFSGPHIVVKQGANFNLYWIQRCDKKELQLVNVGRLIKANVYNSDLGEPLGAKDFDVMEEGEEAEEAE